MSTYVTYGDFEKLIEEREIKEREIEKWKILDRTAWKPPYATNCLSCPNRCHIENEHSYEWLEHHMKRICDVCELCSVCKNDKTYPYTHEFVKSAK